jgi:flagellar basal body L-ring protein FlgH
MPVFRPTIGLLVILQLSGCANMFAEGYRDPSAELPIDGPTHGGRWTERGLLADDPPEGLFGRHRLSDAGRAPAGQAENSWIAPERREALERDARRDFQDGARADFGIQEPSFSTTPNFVPAAKQNYRAARATRNDFVDQSQSEGSLWASDGQTNYYFTKNKVRSIGDIIALKLEKDLHQDIAQEIKRTLNPREREHELILAQERLRAQAQTPERTPASAAAGQKSAVQKVPAKAKEREPSLTPSDAETLGSANSPAVRDATYADIDVAPNLELKPEDLIMGEIVERYPNGNYKIRGIKKIPYKAGNPRLVSIVGIVKSTDITEDDSILSGKLYEYRLEAAR